jgi:hypothetical protein
LGADRRIDGGGLWPDFGTSGQGDQEYKNEGGPTPAAALAPTHGERTPAVR